MAQIKRKDDLQATDEVLEATIILPDKKEQKAVDPLKPAYDIHIEKTLKTDYSVDELKYKDKNKLDVAAYTEKVKKRQKRNKIWKAILGFFKLHLKQPILMLIVDIAIFGVIASLFGDAGAKVFGDVLNGLSHNKIITGILAVIVIIFIVPYIFDDGDMRTDAQKKTDKEVDRIMDRLKNRPH